MSHRSFNSLSQSKFYRCEVIFTDWESLRTYCARVIRAQRLIRLRCIGSLKTGHGWMDTGIRSVLSPRCLVSFLEFLNRTRLSQTRHYTSITLAQTSFFARATPIISGCPSLMSLFVPQCFESLYEVFQTVPTSPSVNNQTHFQ